MMAPLGAYVTIAPYDWRGEGLPPTAGDVLQTSTGRTYLILCARATSLRNRFRLGCLVTDRIEAGARVYELRWNDRMRISRPRSSIDQERSGVELSVKR